jgi:hypothetical protein
MGMSSAPVEKRRGVESKRPVSRSKELRRMGARASASPRIDRPRRSGVELPLRLSILARVGFFVITLSRSRPYEAEWVKQCSGGAKSSLSEIEGVGLDGPAVRRHGWVGDGKGEHVQPGQKQCMMMMRDSRTPESHAAPLTVIVNWRASRRHLETAKPDGAWFCHTRRTNSC